MNRIDVALLIATLLFVYSASAQTPRAGDGFGAAQVDAIYPDIEKLYTDLHRNPELAFHEQRTAATLAARVKALGYEVTTGVGGTGVVAILKNGPGPIVMLRTELDALPIEEKTGLPFASTVKTKAMPANRAGGAHVRTRYSHVGVGRYGRTHGEEPRALAWHADAGRATGRGNRRRRDRDAARWPVYALSETRLRVGHARRACVAGRRGRDSTRFFRANSTSLDMTVYGTGGHGAFPQARSIRW
jgi:hippurate hydrolase